ncbi:coenzyme PQQ synthesis protein B [Streptomyces longispororuber]|uniref:Coenzyme PQQ synthesis protein B n=1 Tax=Streptomyces longispororuber TaxID=68230 RepID=A0A918ZQS0_9ACTN|nr:MBL fold metallo-hydrolase [Streptomyces longispororuber]GHE63237.1 coenzyme PQQ synthesis protein B [Streptomyces longispororuber]
MLLQVLGTAAGGGLPQWNCACPGCAGARAHPGRRRLHASLAVHAGRDRWYLVNATPDLGEQLERCPELLPDPAGDPRRTPVAGVLLTDAELDHTLGIARLREARDGVEVYATAPVEHAVRERLGLGAVLAPYTAVRWRGLTGTGAPLGDGAGVHVSAVPVSAKRPRYAADTASPDAGDTGAAGLTGDTGAIGDTENTGDTGAVADVTSAGDAWSVALCLRDTATGGTLLYAPALAVWSDAFEEAAQEADVVLVDGTFWDDEEPLRAGFSRRTATGMGHLPITGPGGTAARLARLPGRCLYTHLNNTNPLGDPDAEQHRQLAAWGLAVADERMVIEL